MRVLIVDDSPDARRLVRTVVAGVGAEVVGERVNGRAGVMAAVALAPDVVILDWDMPVMDGIEATAAILRRRPGIEVIAFSSARQPEIAARFLEAGAARFIDKADVRGLTAALRGPVAAAGT